MDALHTRCKRPFHRSRRWGDGAFVSANDLLKQAQHFCRRFSPQLLQVEAGHGRIEWRGIKVIPLTAINGLPSCAVGALDRIRQLSPGRQEVETVWLITA
jgi:hypothetical protein